MTMKKSLRGWMKFSPKRTSVYSSGMTMMKMMSYYYHWMVSFPVWVASGVGVGLEGEGVAGVAVHL